MHHLIEHSNLDALERQIAHAHWSQTANTLVGGWVMMVIITALMWDTVDTSGLVIWLLLAGAINMEGWWARTRFPAADAPIADVRRWRNRFSVGASIAGMIWGSTMWLLVPLGDWSLYILCVSCATAAFGSLMHNAVSFRVIVASSAGTLIPSAAYVLYALEWNAPHLAAAALLMFTFVFIAHFAHGHSRLVRSSMLLGIENDRLRLMAERATAAKSRFLAAASHDLRQPMASVGLLVSLARDSASSAEMKRILDKADESVAALESLLTGLLDLSRLEQGAVNIQRQTIHLQELFSGIKAHEHPAAARKGIQLRFHPTRAACVSDPVLLERILRNLVSNAIRYTHSGGVLVGVRRRENGERLVIEVWDTGIGIALQDQYMIFEEFVQLDKKKQSDGLGLGLAIVRRSADMLGHRISVHSVQGRGSCFRIEVPAALNDTVDSIPSSEATRRSTTRLTGQVTVVLEDDGSVREALVDRLKAWGAIVYAFSKPDDLTDWLNQGAPQPTLIISDVKLSTSSGIDAIDAIRDRYANSRIPIAAVLITGQASESDLDRAHQRGIPVLQKPFRADVLLDRLVRPV